MVFEWKTFLQLFVMLLVTVLWVLFVVELHLSKQLPPFYKGKGAAILLLGGFPSPHVLYNFVASRGNELRSICLTTYGII